MSPLASRIGMALQNPQFGGGPIIRAQDAPGTPDDFFRVPPPTTSGPPDSTNVLMGDPSGAGVTSPNLFGPVRGGDEPHWTPNELGGVTMNDFGWREGMGLPSGPISGFGYNAPSGLYAPGGGPTIVPTFWGPAYGNTPANAANPNAGGGYAGGGGGGAGIALAQKLDNARKMTALL